MKKTSKGQLKNAGQSFVKAGKNVKTSVGHMGKGAGNAVKSVGHVAKGIGDTFKSIGYTAKGLYETINAGDIAIYNKIKQKFGDSTNKIINFVQKNLLTVLISATLVTGGGNAVYNKVQDKKENRMELVTVEKGDYLIKIIIESIDLTEEEIYDYPFIEELVSIVAETNGIPKDKVGNIKIGQEIKIDHYRIEKARKENKKNKNKDKKEEISGGDGKESSNTTNFVERFDKGYKYFDDANEKLGEKKIIDTYVEYKNSKFNFEKVEWVEWKLTNRKHEPIDLGKIEKVILHSTGIGPYSQDGIKTVPAQIYIDKGGKIYLLGQGKGDNFKVKGINHAGISKWENKDKSYFKKHSIGIEVDANAKEERNDKQYKAVKQALYWIAITYNENLKASDILTHTQIAEDTINGRGRKTDPYYVNWGKLGLSNNYYLIDYDVAMDNVEANHPSYKKQVELHLPPGGDASEVVYSNKESNNIKIAKGVNKAVQDKNIK